MTDVSSPGLSESIKKLQSVKRDDSRYHRLGLKRNPFPASGLAPSNPVAEPFETVRQKILTYLGQFIQTAQSRGLAILGNYGYGKSYHLNYIHSVLKSHHANMRIVHITDPGVHPYQIIRSILLSLGEEEIASMVWSIISRYLSAEIANDDAFLTRMVRSSARGKKAPAGGKYLLEYNLSHLGKAEWSDHRLFFAQLDKELLLDREQLLERVTRILIARDRPDSYITDSQRIARDLASICILDGIPALEQWGAMTSGVGQGAIESGEERQFFNALLHLLRKAGTEYFVLLLDEFEKVPQLARMTDRDARFYLDTLRMLIDEGHENLPFAYVIASNIDAWEVANQKIAPLHDRFDTISLPSTIDDDVARYIVQQLLESALNKETRRKSHSLAPFEIDFPAGLPLDARRTPRQLMKVCHALLEAAIESDRDAIDSELISSIIGANSAASED